LVGPSELVADSPSDKGIHAKLFKTSLHAFSIVFFISILEEFKELSLQPVSHNEDEASDSSASRNEEPSFASFHMPTADGSCCFQQEVWSD